MDKLLSQVVVCTERMDGGEMQDLLHPISMKRIGPECSIFRYDIPESGMAVSARKAMMGITLSLYILKNGLEGKEVSSYQSANEAGGYTGFIYASEISRTVGAIALRRIGWADTSGYLSNEITKISN